MLHSNLEIIIKKTSFEIELTKMDFELDQNIQNNIKPLFFHVEWDRV